MSGSDTRTDDEEQYTGPRTEELRLDRGHGSGSLSVEESWVDENSREPPNDGRSETVTTFRQNDDSINPVGPPQEHRHPADRTTWSDLAKTNDGVGHPDRKTHNRRADARRWVLTFCSQLDCNEYQTERTKWIVERIVESDNDVIDQQNVGRNLSVEKIILGVLSLVVDNTTQVQDAREWSFDDWIVNNDTFCEMMDAVGMDRDELWTVRVTVKRRTDFFDDE